MRRAPQPQIIFCPTKSQRLRQGLLWVAGFALPLGLAAAALLALFYHDFLAVPAPICAALLAGGAGLSAAMLWTARRGEVRAFAVLSAAGTLCLMLAWFGSIDIWKRQFEAGTAVARPDYHAARWQWASERHPLIARFVTEPPGSNATEHPGNR